MFIEFDEEGLELHLLIVQRLKRNVAIFIIGLPAVVNHLVSECRDNDACDGWQWTFINLYDVRCTWRLCTFALHRAAIGVTEPLGHKVPNYITPNQGSLPSTTGITLAGWLLEEFGVRPCPGHDRDQDRAWVLILSKSPNLVGQLTTLQQLVSVGVGFLGPQLGLNNFTLDLGIW